MNPTKNAEIAAADSDLRIALLLGIANWFLFLDHVPHNVVNALTMRNFGFSGATDLFVFVGGYATTLIYTRMAVERGMLVAATRIFRRVWQLYAAYIVLFVIYVELISYVAARTAAPAPGPAQAATASLRPASSSARSPVRPDATARRPRTRV